jgi:hypothetical protein
MKPLLCLLCTVALAAPLAAEPMNRVERERALSELYVSRKLFLDSVADESTAIRGRRR